MAIVEGSTNQVAQVLTAIAQLLWPVAILVLVYKLLPELKLIFHRISESKNLKIKWGDTELSVQEAADNIQRVVGSLIDAEATHWPGQPTASVKSAKEVADRNMDDVGNTDASLKRVLWVDDKPRGNALEMARLKDRGIQIDEALSTEEALEFFVPHKYSVVITDMYRRERGVGNPRAGIDLLRALRAIDPNVKVIAYCAPASARGYGALFLELGGRAVTSETVNFFELLNQYIGKS